MRARTTPRLRQGGKRWRAGFIVEAEASTYPRASFIAFPIIQSGNRNGKGLGSPPFNLVMEMEKARWGSGPFPLSMKMLGVTV
jgi:hypothetical protein